MPARRLDPKRRIEMARNRAHVVSNHLNSQPLHTESAWRVVIAKDRLNVVHNQKNPPLPPPCPQIQPRL